MCCFARRATGPRRPSEWSGRTCWSASSACRAWGTSKLLGIAGQWSCLQWQTRNKINVNLNVSWKMVAASESLVKMRSNGWLGKRGGETWTCSYRKPMGKAWQYIYIYICLMVFKFFHIFPTFSNCRPKFLHGDIGVAHPATVPRKPAASETPKAKVTWTTETKNGETVIDSPNTSWGSWTCSHDKNPMTWFIKYAKFQIWFLVYHCMFEGFKLVNGANVLVLSNSLLLNFLMHIVILLLRGGKYGQMENPHLLNLQIRWFEPVFCNYIYQMVLVCIDIIDSVCCRFFLATVPFSWSPSHPPDCPHAFAALWCPTLSIYMPKWLFAAL